MTLALDTDVLVSWAMTGAPRHQAVRALVARELRGPDSTIGLVPQVMFEFVHVVTDPRRFASPLSMTDAISLAGEVWSARQVTHIVPVATVVPRTFELLTDLHLGRKRILDTALAATLEAAGVGRLATFNARDYAIFSFLEIVSPRA
jgi:predicted nucleic acid-binding protein